MEVIQVFIGTKAQYIKTAPLLRLMEKRSVPFRLIDTGQHGAIVGSMRAELGVRDPDVQLGGEGDVSTIRGGISWMLKLLSMARSRERVRSEIFGGFGGVCVVHGDTTSTLLSSLLAWRAGLRVAHLEAGLRSNNIFEPFPEEIVRMIVMRFADVCFAPTPDAVANLTGMRKRGVVVALEGNTSIEATSFAVGEVGDTGTGPAVVTMHRLENLNNRSRVRLFVETVCALAARMPVRFVEHEPTRLALEGQDFHGRLEEAGVEVSPLVGHGEFVALLRDAPLVIIDGGSIQEECAYLGVPTLLWREKSERKHGVGQNVVLSKFDQGIIDDFIDRPEQFRRSMALPDVQPSETILDYLEADIASSCSS